MCGIAGIFGITDTGKATELVRRMNDCQAHRGPDDAGIYVEENIALGHRRLSIIDLSSAGQQPLQSYHKRYQIIFNGELYNYLEIKSQFGDYPFQTKTDTEVVLASYEKWGADCLHHFNGMYAFALWDTFTKELFIARDRLGVKPLYYYHKDGLMLFASELRTLLSTNLVPRKINTSVINEYFTYQTVHAPATIIENVSMLMPGHFMKVSTSGVTNTQYWSPSTHVTTEAKYHSKKEVLQNVNDLLYASVKRRLISDVPFGAFLSGGIDSSIIVGLMSKIQQTAVETFTITFDESKFSESRYAGMIAEKFKTNHHEFRLKPDDFLNDLPNALLAMDHPSGDGPNSYTVSKITREAGIKMALSGLGGDELFAGYPVFKRTLALQSKSWIWKLPKPLRIAAGKAYAAAKPGASSEKFLQLLKHSGAGIEHTFPVSRQISTAETVQSILKTLPHADALQQILKKQLNGNHSLENLSKVSIAEMTTYMQNILLRDADQMSMSVALEVRVPFLDYQLVEYVLGISDELKYPTYPKKLLIESIGDLLPSEIIHREKMGFTFPWSLWLKNELRNFCEEKILALSNRSFIKETVLINRWNKFLAGSPLVRWPDIWIGVVLENWLEQNNIDA